MRQAKGREQADDHKPSGEGLAQRSMLGRKWWHGVPVVIDMSDSMVGQQVAIMASQDGRIADFNSVMWPLRETGKEAIECRQETTGLKPPTLEFEDKGPGIVAQSFLRGPEDQFLKDRGVQKSSVDSPGFGSVSSVRGIGWNGDVLPDLGTDPKAGRELCDELGKLVDRRRPLKGLVQPDRSEQWCALIGIGRILGQTFLREPVPGVRLPVHRSLPPFVGPRTGAKPNFLWESQSRHRSAHPSEFVAFTMNGD